MLRQKESSAETARFSSCRTEMNKVIVDRIAASADLGHKSLSAVGTTETRSWSHATTDDRSNTRTGPRRNRRIGTKHSDTRAEF